MRLYIALINSIIPHSTSRPSKKRFTGRCFLSCPAKTYRTEIKTVKGIRIISVIKLKVQNPTKNSIATAIATFSRISFEKKRPPSAFSIALVKRESSTNNTQNTVSFNKVRSQNPAQFNAHNTNPKKLINTM